MADKRGTTNPPGITGTGQRIGELPNYLRDDLAQMLLTVLRTISNKAGEPEKELPAAATLAIDRFHGISCALATVSDLFNCVAPPPPPPPAEG